MSLSRGEVMGFLRGQIALGQNASDAKSNFVSWLNAQAEAVATQKEKDAIVSDIDSYVL